MDIPPDRRAEGGDTVEKELKEGVCTLPDGVPCILLFNAEMDCGDCGFYDDKLEAVKWE